MDDSNFGDIGKSVRCGEQDSIVHDWNSRFLRAVNAPQDFTPRQHAAAAMNDKTCAWCLVLGAWCGELGGMRLKRETISRRKDEVELLSAGKFRERLGNLYSTDIIALAMVRAALGY